MSQSQCIPKLFAEEKNGVYSIYRSSSHIMFDRHVNVISPEPMLSVASVSSFASLAIVAKKRKVDKTIYTTLARNKTNNIFRPCLWKYVPEVVSVSSESPDENGMEIAVINFLKI